MKYVLSCFSRVKSQENRCVYNVLIVKETLYIILSLQRRSSKFSLRVKHYIFMFILYIQRYLTLTVVVKSMEFLLISFY